MWEYLKFSKTHVETVFWWAQRNDSTCNAIEMVWEWCWSIRRRRSLRGLMTKITDSILISQIPVAFVFWWCHRRRKILPSSCDGERFLVFNSQLVRIGRILGRICWYVERQSNWHIAVCVACRIIFLTQLSWWHVHGSIATRKRFHEVSTAFRRSVPWKNYAELWLMLYNIDRLRA